MIPSAEHRTRDELDAGLGRVVGAPKESGVIELIARRPAVSEREEVEQGEITVENGLEGDNWLARGSGGGGPADPETQITIVNSAVAGLVAGGRDRWALFGDQLYVDLDLSEENLPPGTRLRVGSAELQVSPRRHTPCAKYARRFGLDAYRFVSTKEARLLRLRGMNTRVVRSGRVDAGDTVTKVRAQSFE